MKNYSIYNATIAILLLVVAAAIVYFIYSKNLLENRIQSLQSQVSALSLAVSSSTTTSTANSSLTTNNQVPVAQKTQDQLLTSAVAKVAPSVVSIVISQQVPQLEVTYINPFGDNPAFKDFGFQVPVYRRSGSKLQKVGAGTGFIVSSSGYILTNKHVVDTKDAQYTVLLSDGSQKSATVVYRDTRNDIAVIKIEGSGYTAAPLGNSSTLQLGQTVTAIGNALGEYSNSVSVGIISGLDRNVEAMDSLGNVERLTGVIQTDAAINPGNSGGPLIDLKGNVVGVNVATVQGSNSIGFSLPINTVKSIVNQVVK